MAVSLRESKSALIKIQVLKSALNQIGKKAFKDLFIDKICEQVNISKVTLFKYFPQKEDILLYYLRVWCLERAVELNKKNREGMEGVRYLFESMATAYDRHPGIILSLVSYLTSLDRPPAPFPLKPAERELLHPNIAIEQIEVFSLQQMMEKFLLEAVFKKEITAKSDTKELALLFMSMFYGTIVIAHLRQVDPINVFFKRNIDNLIKGLN